MRHSVTGREGVLRELPGRPVVPSNILASNPPDTMLAKTLRVAAIRNIALEPQRKDEVAKRVENLKTSAEAVEYIKEVEAELKAHGRH